MAPRRHKHHRATHSNSLKRSRHESEISAKCPERARLLLLPRCLAVAEQEAKVGSINLRTPRRGAQRDRGVTWGRIETSKGGRDLVDSPEYPITGRRYRDVVGPRPPVACFSASSRIGTSGRRFIVRESLTATELWPEHLAEPRPVPLATAIYVIFLSFELPCRLRERNGAVQPSRRQAARRRKISGKHKRRMGDVQLTYILLSCFRYLPLQFT